MSAILVDRILGVLDNGLVAWKKYLSTRQEAYNRKMDINQKRAINEAEEAFRRLLELDIDVNDKQFLRARRLFYKYKSKT